VPKARQRFADVRVGDAPGDMMHRIRVEGIASGLLAAQKQDRHGDLTENLGVSRLGSLIARALLAGSGGQRNTTSRTFGYRSLSVQARDYSW
jgi:hypothetical protein